ncbi:hypothetical protein PN499_22720 [Kamptonema animale CS-326]|nr:hypothetical protein [Kamptonema animale]MDB9514016.1 hypothetical protein [Kamptonema animale CS-326]
MRINCYESSRTEQSDSQRPIEMVLEDKFGLPRSNWVEDENYYFGP